jgi:methyltransferase-like protein
VLYNALKFRQVHKRRIQLSDNRELKDIVAESSAEVLGKRLPIQKDSLNVRGEMERRKV